MIVQFIKRHYPVLFLVLLWFVFSFPFFLQNKAPYPANYQVTTFPPWSAYPEFGRPVKNDAMPDILVQIYPWRHLSIEGYKNGEIALWNPYSFSGTTHLANYQSAVLSPLNVLFFIFDFKNAWSILVLLQPLLASLFTYLFLRTLKISREGSLVGGISFMFCGFITTWMEYATLGYAILFLPLALLAIEKYKVQKNPIYLVLLSLTIPLSFLSGHFQTSLYFLIFVTGYLFFSHLKNRNLSLFTIPFLFIVFGLLLSMPQILPSIEVYSQSLRSDLFQKIETIPLNYIPTFVAPDIFGNPVTRNAWFGHYAEWNAYTGALPLFLALFALIKRRKEALFFAIAGVIALLLAFYTPFLDILVRLKIPVISTAAASRVIVIFSFSIATLSAFGFDYLLAEIKSNKLSKRIVVWGILWTLVMASLWVMVIAGMGLDDTRKLIARNNLILPTLVFAGSLFVIGIATLNKRLAAILGLALIFIVSFDMLRFANKWLPFDPKDMIHPKTQVIDYYPKITSFDRVFGNYGADNSDYYQLPGIEGYDAVYIKRYGEFVNAVQTGKPSSGARSGVVFPKYGPNVSKALDLLGVRFIVHKVSDDGKGWSYPFSLFPDDKFKEIFDDGIYRVFEARDFVPRTFLTSDYIVEKNDEQIIEKLFSEDFDIRRQIILEEDPNVSKRLNASGFAGITKYSLNSVVVQTDSLQASLLFLSDVYYPGWKAKIDGKEVKIYRADYTFRAVPVPAGKHKVEFVYNPQGFKYGVLLAVVGAIGTLIFPMLYFRRNGRNRKA